MSGSELGEMWDAYRKRQQEKRARNREAAAEKLTAAGIPFESKNSGAHLIVAERYDFWPGTGLWICRGDHTKQRGIAKLIRRIRDAS